MIVPSTGGNFLGCIAGPVTVMVSAEPADENIITDDYAWYRK